MAEYNGQFDSAINDRYKTLFGREAAAGGLNYWGGLLANPDSGVTFETLDQALIAGAQGSDLDYYNKNVINSKYNDAFGRDAGEEGLSYWGGLLANPDSGVTESNLDQALVAGAQGSDVDSHNDILSGGDGLYNDTPDTPVDTEAPGGTSNTNPGNTNSGNTNSGSTTTRTLPVTMPEVSLDTVEPYVPSEADTVAGRLNGLLASESQYMQAAREAGERDAQARGLLNSSLAAEASEKAAIEAALPIAQQDSQSLISTAADQNIVNTKAYQSAQLSAQEANQTSLLNDQQNQAASDLSTQDAEQDAALEEIKQQWANYRQQVELDFNDSMSAMELTTNEKNALASSIQALGDSFQSNVAGIQISDKGRGTRTAAINDLADVYQANIEALGSIYGVEVTWSGFEMDWSHL